MIALLFPSIGRQASVRLTVCGVRGTRRFGPHKFTPAMTVSVFFPPFFPLVELGCLSRGCLLCLSPWTSCTHRRSSTRTGVFEEGCRMFRGCATQVLEISRDCCFQLNETLIHVYSPIFFLFLLFSLFLILILLLFQFRFQFQFHLIFVWILFLFLKPII